MERLKPVFLRAGRLLILGLTLVLAACGTDRIYDSDEFLAQQRFVSSEPPSLTLITVISNGTNGGAHTGLIVNASERVIFDPAGTFRHPNMPERYDVIFGVTDGRLATYIDYHARVTYRVQVQKVLVSPEVAELALQMVQKAGPVPKANCANATSELISKLPGFGSVRKTWFPRKLADSFGKIPGVSERIVYDDSPDNNKGILYGAP